VKSERLKIRNYKRLWLLGGVVGLSVHPVIRLGPDQENFLNRLLRSGRKGRQEEIFLESSLSLLTRIFNSASLVS
jgi:hypothetical protein